MPSTVKLPITANFFDLTAPQFDEIVLALGWPKFRGQQVRDWVYIKRVADPARMSNLSKADQETLAANVRFATSSIAANQLSSDDTLKLLLTWENGSNAETVMIPDGPRRTACVSSQVGCPVGCKFCASGVAASKEISPPGRSSSRSSGSTNLLRRAQESGSPHRLHGHGRAAGQLCQRDSAIRVLHDPSASTSAPARSPSPPSACLPKMRALAERRVAAQSRDLAARPQ